MKELKITETADAIPQWFKDYSKEQQQDYLRDHPNSKLALDYKEKEVKELKSKPVEEKLENGKDVIKLNGSPTDFTGPNDKSGSPTGNVKAERYVAALLNKLADLADKAIAEGKKEPDYDLCDIQIPGTNLFCELNLGVSRKEMPQLKGKPEKDSWADKNLDKDENGEVDAEKAFMTALKNKGIKISKKSVPANSLKATQKELVGTKVAGMTKALQEDPHDKDITAPIFISRDGYVLDGHHRWAAQVGLGIKAGIKEPIIMDAQVINMDMEDLLKLTNDFCEKIGIKPKAGKVAEHSKLFEKFLIESSTKEETTC